MYLRCTEFLVPLGVNDLNCSPAAGGVQHVLASFVRDFHVIYLYLESLKLDFILKNGAKSHSHIFSVT